MRLEIRVLRDHAADLPETAYRAFVLNSGLGVVDAAGPTPAEAEAKVRRRYRLRWLGVEWPGVATPGEALNLISGQVAINGHRFALWRQLMHRERLVHWIMLNPSTASAGADDATMRRVCDFSRRWQFGWVTVGNLWSYRATDSEKLKTWLDRGGEWVARTSAECMQWVESMAQRADLVVVAWGVRGQKDRRGLAVLRHLAQLGIEPHALALTRSGEPAHPLRLSASVQPQPLSALRGERQ